MRTIRVVYPDLHGVQRGKDVPLTEFDRAARGLNFCWAVMGTDLQHTPVVGGESGYPDMLATPDLSTLVRAPLGARRRLCPRRPDPLRRPGADRHARRSSAVPRRASRSSGVTAKVGPELEFFVCEPDGNGGWRRHVDNLSMVYTVGPQADPQNILKGMLSACAELGIGAIAANHEFMNSQYEINLREATPLVAADAAFRFKSAIKDFAAQRGLLATFMGKPFNDQGGSGFHLHLSLERDGENCFADESDGDGLSPMLRQFAAGILRHGTALMAFLNPTVNAYRRILPDSLAPINVNWGLDNRTTFVRIPPERGGGCRIEIRVGDGAANPHLVIAAVIFAGLDGLRNELEPPAMIDGDAYALDPSEQGEPLPASLADSLDALEADEVLRDAVGAEIVDTFLAVKRFELERYRLHISDWELTEYLHHL